MGGLSHTALEAGLVGWASGRGVGEEGAGGNLRRWTVQRRDRGEFQGEVKRPES